MQSLPNEGEPTMPSPNGMRALGFLCLLVLLGGAAGAADEVLDTTEYRHLVALYGDLVVQPPVLDKTTVQNVAATAAALVAAMPMDQFYHGVPHRVLGARLALRIASVMAHRHSYCEDARTIGLAARQAYADWAAADPAKTALCAAWTASLDSTAAALQTQNDGDFPPPAPLTEPTEARYALEAPVVSGTWNVAVKVNGAIVANATGVTVGWQHTFTATSPFQVQVQVQRVGSGGALTVELRSKGGGVLASASADPSQTYNYNDLLVGSF